MNFIEGIKERARKEIKRIVLPEASDLRIIKAADTVLKENYAEIILIGNEENIKKMAEENNLDISKATIVNPLNSERSQEYAEKLYELRKEEYNKLIENYSEIVTGLESAYSDNKLTKKEYSIIYDDVVEVYSESYVENNYKLAQMNTVNSVTSIILTIIYFVVIQYFTKGQTVGKKLFKYRIKTNDLERVTINNLLLRSLIITDIIWASIRLYCLYTMDAYGYDTATFYLNNIMYLVLFISLLFVIYRKDKRALQDLFAGTRVIEE